MLEDRTYTRDGNLEAKRKRIGGVFVLGLFLGVLLAHVAYIRSSVQPIIIVQSSTTHVDNGLGNAANLEHNCPSPATATESPSVAGSACNVIPRPQSAPSIEDARLRELHEVLTGFAPEGEVLVVISNYTPILNGMLITWLDAVRRAKVKNYVIVAIDASIQEWCRKEAVQCWHRTTAPPKAQDGTGDNHAISAAKFEILSDFLALGWGVLLSDVDVLTVSNPFEKLHRDHDVEGMSDGFDDRWAYGMIDGFDDPSMGWARYGQIYKRFAMNSGLFYLRPTGPALELMQRCAARLEKQTYWDQTVYNEELFFMSHGEYLSPRATVRVMDIDVFMNSKRLFKTVRHMDRKSQPIPAMVHMNYHPDKHERMKAAAKYYFEGDGTELMRFPGGSEPGT